MIKLIQCLANVLPFVFLQKLGLFFLLFLGIFVGCTPVHQTPSMTGPFTDDKNESSEASSVSTSTTGPTNACRLLPKTKLTIKLSIDGHGFFVVVDLSGYLLHTRVGEFHINSNCQVATSEGFLVDPKIVVSPSATKIDVHENGEVWTFLEHEELPQFVGEIYLSRFASVSGLIPVGQRFYKPSPRSGNAMIVTPGMDGGRIKQGELNPTLPTIGNDPSLENDLVLNIQGKGFFQVLLPNATIAYTRKGTFSIDGKTGGLFWNSNREIWLTPEIMIPSITDQIIISPDGVVSVYVVGDPQPHLIGEIILAHFPNEKALTSIGNHLFLPSGGSGEPTLKVPGLEGVGKLIFPPPLIPNFKEK